MKGLRENHVEAVLIIPYGSKLEKISSKRQNFGHHEGIPFYFVRKNRDIRKILRFLDIFLGVFKTASILISLRKKKKLDAVVIAGADILRDSPVIAACLIFRIPLFFWFVEKMSLSEDFSGVIGFLNRQSQKITEKISPKIGNGLIVISTALNSHYLKYIKQKKILINPVLVSTEMIKVPDQEIFGMIKERLKREYNYKYLLVYNGSYGEKDGIYYLIDSFHLILRDFPDTLFIMTGKNHDKLIMNRIIEYIRNKGLENRIILTGFVKSEELSCYNNLADILLVCRSDSPFANHGFPWKLGEYCMTGRPVIATKVSDIGLYFRDNEDLFIVEAENSKAVAEKAVYIFNNYDSALGVAKRGKETALKCFGYLERTRELAEFIKDNLN
jgi:glycosyltransferase involved in cell wall biosynthesis